MKMEEEVSVFPFKKLKYDKFLTLEIMMFLEYSEVLEFMFNINRASRNFIESNASTIINGYSNDGLQYKEFKCDFIHC